MSRRSLTVEDLKSVEVTGCSSVERMLKSADASLKKLEKHYPKNSTLKQTLTVIVSYRRIQIRDKNPRPSSKWVTAHEERVADNGGTEKIHQVRRGQEQIRLSRRYRQDEEAVEESCQHGIYKIV
jgi:hypothetical protein